MPLTSLVVAAGVVMPVANDGSALHTIAEVRDVRPDAIVTPRRDPTAELLLYVECGIIEVMIEGATEYVSEGANLRIGAGRTYAYRTAGDALARVLTVRLNGDDRRNFAAKLVASVAA